MKKIILSSIIFCLCFAFGSINFADAKMFKDHLNSIGNYLNHAKYGQLVDTYAKSRSTGYLIGTFLSEGHYYSKSILKTEIKQTDYLVLQKKTLTASQWNSYFTSVNARKRGIVIARKVPTCSIYPQAVVFQVVKKNNGVVTLKGYLETYISTLHESGLL
ncbi:MAG: hypothetical protein WC663_03745 [Patescibacteria group bacterium]|jgi:hypothetical protein